MGIPLLRGREFTDADGRRRRRSSIVSQATAQRFWGDDDPIGRTLHASPTAATFTVVGVVGDVRQHGAQPGVAGDLLPERPAASGR